MKKFSNIDKVDYLKKPHNIVLSETIKTLIDEYITVGTNDENALLEDSSIEGKEELIKLVENYINKAREDFKEKLEEKYSNLSAYFVNHNILNNKISVIRESLDKINLISSPKDIFNKNDFEKIDEDTIVLEKLENIPEEYFMSYISTEQSDKYFEDKNKINIHYKGLNEGWNIEFIPELKNKIGTITEKRISFLAENADFIEDFIRSAKMLIGENKINIITNQ